MRSLVNATTAVRRHALPLQPLEWASCGQVACLCYYRGAAPPAVVPPRDGAAGSLPPSARIFMLWSACVNLSVLLALSAASGAVREHRVVEK